MVFDANYDTSSTESISIAIPGISNVMVIGTSDTARQFSTNIKNIARFERIYYVDDINAASSFLQTTTCGIVVIDGDDTFDTLSCTRVVRIHNSQARIVLISKQVDKQHVFDLKNKGIIHGFISIPCEDLLAHTIIVQEQAKYHINQSLSKMLISPPKHSSSYRRLSKSDKKAKHYEKFNLRGVAIVEETVTKFSMFFDADTELHPVLLTSYFSAISVFGSKLLPSENGLHNFEFEGFNIIMKKVTNLQYVYFMGNINEESAKEAQELANLLTSKIQIQFGDVLFSTSYLTDEQEEAIEKLVLHHLPQHQRKDYFYEAEAKLGLLNYKEPNRVLSEIYDETERVYAVHYVDDEGQMLDTLNQETIDVVIFNRFEDNVSRNITLINIIKDDSPYTQCIAVLQNLNLIPLATLLNINDLDYIIDGRSSTEDYYALLKKAIERSGSIKQGLEISDLSGLPRTYERSEIIKTMLRMNVDKFDASTIPSFSGLFVLVENMKYYSNYLVEDKDVIIDNEALFIGFIESLLTFTDEISNSPLAFTGIQYGDSHLIIQNRFEYTLIYFVANLDNTNYDFVKEVLDSRSTQIYETIKQDEDAYFLSNDNSTVIDQICLETSIQFSMLEDQ